MAKPAAQPKAIIFDCWNTLFYAEARPLLIDLLSRTLLHKRINYALTKRFERSIMLAPENDFSAAATKVLRSIGLPPLPPLVRRVERALQSPGKYNRPYHDTFATLDILRRTYKLGIITNSYELAFEPLRHDFKLDECFDAVITSYETGVLKPDPQIFKLTLEELGVRPRDAVMIGDNLRDDIKAAEAAGLTGVLIDRHGRHPDARPRVESLAELPELIAKTSTRI